MGADSRDVDVDAPIRVQHRHGAAPEAAVVHLRTDREIGRAAATEPAKMLLEERSDAADAGFIAARV
jgi:hypothetical protein